MMQSNRNAAWQDIWIKKGLDREAPLHHVNGYDLLSAPEWDQMVAEVTRPLGLTGRESIVECGCGAGAFLRSLLKNHPGLKMAGVDYSPTLIARAREVLAGDFFVADMTDLRFLPSESYDVAASFGVIFYLASEEAARCAVAEMLRLTKPGGMVYLGEVSDLEKREEALAIRRVSHRDVKKVSDAELDHLYLPKSLFRDIAAAHGAKASIVDHADLDLGAYRGARYRYSVYMKKPSGSVS